MATPAFTAPPAGSTLDGTIQVFEWDLGGIPIERGWIYVGSTQGGSQFLSRDVGTRTETSAGDLPTDGSAIFGRLWYRIDGTWSFIDRRWVAASSPALPFLVDPAPGETLGGSTVTFRWSYGGLAVDSAWLYVGSTLGGSDIAAIRSDDEREVTVSGLPLDESTVHARLYFRVAGVWYHVDQTYQSASVPAPTRDELTRELQALVGVTADGVVGPITRAALNQNWVGRAGSFDPSFAARLGNDTDLIQWVQRRLNARSRSTIPEDGEFGQATETAAVADLGRGGVVAVESLLALIEADPGFPPG